MVSISETFSEQVLIKRLKADGTYDELRKSCLEMVENSCVYNSLTVNLNREFSQFLSQQSWKPYMRKEDLLRQLRNHMLSGDTFSNRLPKLITDLMQSHQDQHLRPDVERTASLMMEERERELDNQRKHNPAQVEMKKPQPTSQKNENVDSVDIEPPVEQVSPEEPVKNSPKLLLRVTQKSPEKETKMDTTPVVKTERKPSEHQVEADLDSMSLDERLKFLQHRAQEDDAYHSPDASPLPDEPAPEQKSGLAGLLSKLQNSVIISPLTTDAVMESGSEDGGATPTMDEPGEAEPSLAGAIPIVSIGGASTVVGPVETSSSSSDSSSSDSDSSSSSSSGQEVRRPKMRESRHMREERERKARIPSSRRSSRRSISTGSPSDRRAPRGSPTYEDYASKSPKFRSRHVDSSRDRKRRESREVETEHRKERKRPRSRKPSSSSSNSSSEEQSPRRRTDSKERREQRRERSERSDRSDRDGRSDSYRPPSDIRPRPQSTAGPLRRPPWAVPRHFTPYHHQAAQIRHHKPNFDIRDELNETAQKQARVADTSKKVEQAVEVSKGNPEDGEIEDGEVSD